MLRLFLIVNPSLPIIPDVADLRPVAAGGFSQVFRGRHAVTGYAVACKVFNTASGSVSAQQAFHREVQTLIHVSEGPHIARLFGGGTTEEGRPYLLLQWLAGGSLQDRLDARGPLAWQHACKVVTQVCLALDYAHRCGVVHRDLKPANVLLDRSRHAYLTDFGIASEIDVTVSASPRFSVAFAAPEILRGEQATPASDVYSLAAMAYALLTGAAPFEGSYLQTILAHLQQPADPAPLVRAGVPSHAVDALLAGLAKRPDQRPDSVLAFGRSATHDPCLDRSLSTPTRIS